MAGLPKAADPALAALSTQLPTENLAGAEEEEHLAVDGGRASLDRRTSGAASFRSEYTSATGGNSVYESAAEGSRTTLNTLQPSESERSFPEAQSGLGARDPSNQDLTMHALAQEPSTPVVSDSQHEGTDASTARASAEPTPTGTLASHPSTIRPTVIPRPSPATSDTKKSDDEKRDTSSAEKNDELDLENEAADETIVKEMAGLPEDYRKVLQAQMSVFGYRAARLVGYGAVELLPSAELMLTYLSFQSHGQEASRQVFVSLVFFFSAGLLADPLPNRPLTPDLAANCSALPLNLNSCSMGLVFWPPSLLERLNRS